MTSHQEISSGRGPRVERTCLSVREFGASMGICRTIAYRLIREGKVRSFRVGKRIFIPVSELKAFPERMTD